MRQNAAVRSLSRWLVVALACLGMAQASAQSNEGLRVFEGRWLRVVPADLDPNLPTALTVEWVPGRPTDSVVIARQVGGRTLTDSYRIGIVGGMTGGVVGGPGEPNLRATENQYFSKWDGQTFSFGNEVRASDVAWGHRESWVVDERGRLIATTVDHNTGTPSVTRELVYTRPQ